MRSQASSAVAAILAVTLSTASLAESRPPQDTSGISSWEPSLSFQLGATSEDAEARLSTTTGGPIEGDNRLIFPQFGISTELATPPLATSFFAPRLFMHADFAVALDKDRTILKEGTPGELEIPIIDNDSDGTPDQRTPIAAVQGAGRQVQSLTDWPVFAAGLGVAFELPVGRERRLRIKPSMEYRTETIKVSTSVSAIETIDGSQLCPCRSLRLSGNEKKAYHSIGPGIEFDLEFARVQSLVVSVLTSVRAYYALGNRSVDVRATGTFDDGLPASSSASFSRDQWGYALAFGVRIRWHPE